jgi:hypothetical protein
VGHDYWEVFANSNAAQNFKKLNLLQIRNHNKDYLDMYKKTIGASAGKFESYTTSVYQEPTNKSFVYKAHDVYFNPKLYKNVGKAPADAQFRAAFLADYRQDAATLQHSTGGVKLSGSVTLTKNAFNGSKRFMRANTFAQQNHLSTLPSNKSL